MNETDRMRNFTDLMTSNKRLCQLVNNNRHFQKIESHLLQALPVFLVAHAGLLAYENGILVIRVDNSNWAGKIRFYLPQLTRELKNTTYFKGLRLIKVKVSPRYAAEVKTRKAKRRFLPVNAKKSLLETAESIQDPSLKEALISLARH